MNDWGKSVERSREDTIAHARAWLSALDEEVRVLEWSDYRTKEYETALARVLALTRSGYITNALEAFNDADDGVYPSRRVILGLTRGGEMHVSLPGRPNEPVAERTLEALRAIGEAALDRLLSDSADTLHG